MRQVRFAQGIVGLISFAYAVWQGPLYGKWAEGAFWMALSISAEISCRNLWGKDK